MRPQVVAHRGASHENAEHTLRAYIAALDAGADALECDVRLTADGHLVCVHDRDLRRTASNRGIISTMELAELDQLDFASWKHPWADLDDEAPELDADLDKVLTLRKLLETVADYHRRVEVAIETKHPTRFGGLVERRVVDLALLATGADHQIDSAPLGDRACDQAAGGEDLVVWVGVHEQQPAGLVQRRERLLPGHPLDGVTMNVPLALLRCKPEDFAGVVVPGLTRVEVNHVPKGVVGIISVSGAATGTAGPVLVCSLISAPRSSENSSGIRGAASQSSVSLRLSPRLDSIKIVSSDCTTFWARSGIESR